jgi:hypothetical protein
VRAADKVALLTALKDAAEAELAKAKAEALAVAKEVGVKSFDTSFGAITVARRASAPYVKDPAMLLEYVKHTHPTEVVTVPAVRPAFITALLARVEWSAELQEFVDTTTGEAVPGIDLSEEGAPYITWPSSDAQKDTKQEAKEWFAAQSEQILDGMRQLTS